MMKLYLQLDVYCLPVLCKRDPKFYKVFRKFPQFGTRLNGVLKSGHKPNVKLCHKVISMSNHCKQNCSQFFMSNKYLQKIWQYKKFILFISSSGIGNPYTFNNEGPFISYWYK